MLKKFIIETQRPDGVWIVAAIFDTSEERLATLKQWQNVLMKMPTRLTNVEPN